ncbi:uncharacterized protein LOC121891781 [Scomber scombrus]
MPTADTDGKTGSTTTQDALWPFLYRVAGLVLFVIIVMTIFVASERGCKGVHCPRKSKNPPDPSTQLLPEEDPYYQNIFPIQIYENVNPHIYTNL